MDKEMESRLAMPGKEPLNTDGVQRRIATFGQMCGNRKVLPKKRASVHTEGMGIEVTTETGTGSVRIDRRGVSKTIDVRETVT